MIAFFIYSSYPQLNIIRMATKTKIDKKKDDPCWKAYHQPGTKTKGNK